MIAVINQFNGLGDIIFVCSIAEHYSLCGYKVIFPVNSKYLNLKKHFNKFEMVDMERFNLCDLSNRVCNNPDILYLPLRFSSDCTDQSMTMVNKYSMVKLNHKNWTNFNWQRDRQTEKKLYYDILQLQENEQYNIVNKNRSNKEFKFDVDNGLRNIYLKEYENVTLLDWACVVENAQNIHTVGTSLNYLIELVELKKDCKYYIYNNEYDYSLYSKVIKKDHNRIHI